jgi:hypothetical protein
MLTLDTLRRIAAAVAADLFDAHRGAVPLGRGRSIVAFYCDGHDADPVAAAGTAKARAALAADGYVLGPTVTDPADGYTAVFEAVPPAGTDPEAALEACETAAWEGWAAARGRDPDRDLFARLQRTIANATTAGRTLAHVV